MLDLMRKHAGTWLIKVILGVIIIVFTFWGVGSYKLSQGNRVAVVNGTTITVDQYREAYNRIMEQLRQRFGNSLNDDMIKMFNIEKQALDSVIDQALLLDEAERLHFRVTDEELSAAIRDTPSFQIDGRFDSRRYRRVLSANRLTPESFEVIQRQSMIAGKLRALVSGSIKVSDIEAKELYNWNNTSLDIEYVLFRPEGYADIKTSPEEIETYFNEHKTSYKTEPLIKAQYLFFDSAAYVPKVNVDVDEIRDYYEAHPEQYAKPKTVEARHILFKVGSGDNPEKDEDARKKAVDVLDKIRNGEDFAELAKKYSEGPSKDAGGYIGEFRKEAMVAPFAEEAFSLEAGAVSDPVRTPFGWHIIKVEKINPATTEPLEKAEPAIREKIAVEKAKTLAYDDAESVYEMTFGDNDLSKIAAERGGKLHSTDYFARKGPEKGVKDAAAFATAAFSLKAGEVSDVQDIDGGYYIIHVVDEVAEKIPPLHEVMEKVQTDLVKKKQNEKAKEDAEAFWDQVKGGATMIAAGETFKVDPATTGWFKRNEPISDIGYEPAISQAVFKLSGDAPLSEEVIKGNNGYYVTRFKDKKLPEEDRFDKEKPALKQRLLRQKELEAFNAMLSNIRDRSEIEISEGYRE